MEALLAFALAVALSLGLIWLIGALARHLKARRLGANPYRWQARKVTTTEANGQDGAHRMLRPFWGDLKATLTTPYGRQTTLERAYAASVFLFVSAIFPMPYEYYFTLRIGVCIALWFFAVAAYRKRATQGGWLVAVAVLMVLYNPIMPFHVGVQLVWTAINAATIYALYRAKLVVDRPLAGPSKTVA